MKRSHRYNNESEYRLALAAAPVNDWISDRKIGKGKVTNYIKVEIKQAIADAMFSQWHVVDEKYFVVQNELCCTVKISALPDYKEAEDIIFTGSASTPIQQPAETPIEDFEKEKIKNALEYNLPAVRSSAISNALTTLGNIFGRNIGRKDASNDYGLNLLKHLKPEEVPENPGISEEVQQDEHIKAESTEGEIVVVGKIDNAEDKAFDSVETEDATDKAYFQDKIEIPDEELPDNTQKNRTITEHEDLPF